MLTTGHKSRNKNRAVVKVDQPWCGSKCCSQRLWPPSSLDRHPEMGPQRWFMTTPTGRQSHTRMIPVLGAALTQERHSARAILACQDHLCLTQLACEEAWPVAMFRCIFCSSQSLYLLFIFPSPQICLVALLPLLYLSIHPGVNHLCLIVSIPSCGNKDDISSPLCRVAFVSVVWSLCLWEWWVHADLRLTQHFFECSCPSLCEEHCCQCVFTVHWRHNDYFHGSECLLIWSFSTHALICFTVIQNASEPPDRAVNH